MSLCVVPLLPDESAPFGGGSPLLLAWSLFINRPPQGTSLQLANGTKLFMLSSKYTVQTHPCLFWIFGS